MVQLDIYVEPLKFVTSKIHLKMKMKIIYNEKYL